MGERKHKAEDGEKKDKVGLGKKDSAHITHPILQLQQLVGNKAVTKMIQRHGAQAHLNYDFRVKARDGGERWLRGDSEEQSL